MRFKILHDTYARGYIVSGHLFFCKRDGLFNDGRRIRNALQHNRLAVDLGMQKFYIDFMRKYERIDKSLRRKKRFYFFRSLRVAFG